MIVGARLHLIVGLIAKIVGTRGGGGALQSGRCRRRFGRCGSGSDIATDGRGRDARPTGRDVRGRRQRIVTDWVFCLRWYR